MTEQEKRFFDLSLSRPYLSKYVTANVRRTNPQKLQMNRATTRVEFRVRSISLVGKGDGVEKSLCARLANDALSAAVGASDNEVLFLTNNAVADAVLNCKAASVKINVERKRM